MNRHRSLPILTILILMLSCGRGHKAFEQATHTPGNAAPDPYYMEMAHDEPEQETGEKIAVEIKQGPRHNDRIPIYFRGNLKEIFNDSNKYQYAAAELNGLKPISDLGSSYFTTQPVVKITSSEYYEIDSLKHSLPYLVPKAARLLKDIGRNFIDSLARRGADGYRIRVTSLLRTPQSVRRLRRVNRNAVDSSTHQFGTTFDISFTRFHCLDSSRTIHDGDLKNLLAEVLLDMRRQQRCLVKYEAKGGCFHITVNK